MNERIVIIGAGEAGARAAMALRENGFTGSVTLIGDEPHLPYERPPLSKAVLNAVDDPAPAFILSEATLTEHDITLMRGAVVTAIDRAAHSVTTSDGAVLAYDRLLLATGARPRRLALPGADGVLYLRSFADALALRSHLTPERRIVLIGGGFIGLELAAAARMRGCAVTVIEMAPRLLGRAVPEAIAAEVARRHAAEGVRLILGAGIEAIEAGAGGAAIRLTQGETIACDGIIAGIGAIPETALAEAAGLAIDNGIKADEHLRSSDADIFAAGDCCSFPLALYGGRRVRLEAWRNAQDQGNHAARALLGATEPYAAVPWFWSDQYDATLQIAGLPDEGTQTVRRDIGEDCHMLFHLAPDNRLVAASAFGPNGRIAKDVRIAEMLIGRLARPSPGDIANAGLPLKRLLNA